MGGKFGNSSRYEAFLCPQRLPREDEAGEEKMIRPHSIADLAELALLRANLMMPDCLLKVAPQN